MKNEFLKFKLILRFILLFGVCAYNLVYIKDTDYFMLSFYILFSSMLFLLEGLLKNKKYRGCTYITSIIFSLNFIFTDVKLTTLLVAVLLIEKVKNDIWGNVLCGFIICVGCIINYKIKSSFYFLYNILFFIFIFRSFKYFCEKIEMLDILESSSRKKYITSSKIARKTEEINRQNLKLVRLEERNEIGRKMHDKIGHVIAGSLMRLEAAKIILKLDKNKGEEMVDEVIDNLRCGMDDIRDIIHKTTPLKEEMGINRVKSILIDKLNGSGIKLEVSFNGQISDISYAIWNSIEQFVLELSTNSIKYSECEKIIFRIDVLNKMIKIQFKDNGVGVNNLKKGYGLSKIEEEVVCMGGKTIIDASNGFDVIILVNR